MDVDLSLLPDDFEDCLTSNHEILLRSPFRLLDLPPELWIRVCELAVIRPKSIVLGRESDFADMAKIVRQPNITRACRLLRSEALPVFYGLNEFEMVHNYLVPCPRHFLIAIGATNLRKIGTILIHSNCSHQWWENTFQRGKIKCKVEIIGTNLEYMAPLSWRGLHTYRVTFV
ncbi:hypothetical protein BST61_g4880 [Cercospora zeina]